MFRRFFFPDTALAAAAPAGPIPPVTDTHVRHMRNVPRKDADLSNVCNLVGTQWLASPSITLVWKTQGDFATDAANFANYLQTRDSAGGGQQILTNTLSNVDEQIDDAIPYVKSYINGNMGRMTGRLILHHLAFLIPKQPATSCLLTIKNAALPCK